MPGTRINAIRMKLLPVVITTILVLWSGGLVAQKTLPDVTLKTLDGRTVRVRDYAGKGKITVVSFWATWCSPCKRELDAIKEHYPEWKRKYGVELLAISIDIQQHLPKVAPMVAAKGWPYTILSDATANLKNALQFQSIPKTLLLNQKGHIVYEHTGYAEGDEVQLGERIKWLAR